MMTGASSLGVEFSLRRQEFRCKLHRLGVTIQSDHPGIDGPLVPSSALLDIVAQEPNRHVMKVPLAWRILTYDKRRTALALIGIFMAILLVFVELGFFYAVPRGGLLLYDNMRFDLLLSSDQYEYQAQPGEFPLSQLDRVRSSPDVANASRSISDLPSGRVARGICGRTFS